MKNRIIRRTVWIGSLAVLIAAGSIYWYGFLRKEKPIEKMSPEFELTADSLLSVFISDEKAAMAKYGDKIVLLSSNVISAEKDEKGNVTVTLVDPMMGVTCTIDSLQSVKQKKEIDALVEGRLIKVKGRCDGMLSDVKISKCMIVN
jgi:hypothetical protein